MAHDTDRVTRTRLGEQGLQPGQLGRVGRHIDDAHRGGALAQQGGQLVHLTAALSYFTGATTFEKPTGPIAAAAVVITIPLILVVLLLQRRIVAGLTSGAVKG